MPDWWLREWSRIAPLTRFRMIAPLTTMVNGKVGPSRWGGSPLVKHGLTSPRSVGYFVADPLTSCDRGQLIGAQALVEDVEDVESMSSSNFRA